MSEVPEAYADLLEAVEDLLSNYPEKTMLTGPLAKMRMVVGRIKPKDTAAEKETT